MSLVVPTASDETGSAASFSRTTYFADEPASIVNRSTLAAGAAAVVGLAEGVVAVDGVGVTPAVASTVAAGDVAPGVGIAGAEVSRSGSSSRSSWIATM